MVKAKLPTVKANQPLTLTPEMAVGISFPYIRWLISHATDFKAIFDDFTSFRAAVANNDWTTAMNFAADAFKLVQKIVSDLPTPTPTPAPPTAVELAALQGKYSDELKNYGSILSVLIANLPALIAAIASQDYPAVIALLVSIFSPLWGN